MSIDTAIENMIASYIDEQDFVGRTDASMEAESYTDQCIGDIQDEIGVLMVRLEELEAKPAAEPNLLKELADSVEVKEEPPAVNQIDWIMAPSDIIAGYDSRAMLESYVRACLHNPDEAPMVIAMVLQTARNLIDKQLESQS
jgi:hypothetical protein